ncbi:succinate dehydrogenase cytochrome b subunit [Agilicoccus flavus]|uniref:succinate dehydrogenase cytochrome b subunit n=1 Tax=Agilicoccus flavus TaxID=2775968 RepID=UPI0035579007
MATTTLQKKKPISPMHSTIGLKLMMAVSGLFFVLYVLLHMYGNLKILSGRAAFDEYAHHLRILGEPMLPYGGALWIFRILLLLALVAHVYSAFTLWKGAGEARSHKYAVRSAAAATVSSRWMRWGGVALLAFVVFHLFQFTWLQINVGGEFSSPAARVVAAFGVWWLTLIYVVALIALAMHLRHGVWSACQTLGYTSTARARRTANAAGIVLAVVVAGGFLIPPLGILFGAIK